MIIAFIGATIVHSESKGLAQLPPTKNVSYAKVVKFRIFDNAFGVIWFSLIFFRENQIAILHRGGGNIVPKVANGG